MAIVASRVVYSALFYVLTMMLIVVSKPDLVFNPKTHEPRPFGLGPEKTLFSLGTLTVATAVISYYIFTLIDVVFA